MRQHRVVARVALDQQDVDVHGAWAVVDTAFALRSRFESLGEGKDPSRYWPLTHVEQWVPILFAATYVAGFVALALS